MKRVNSILNHDLFNKCLAEITRWELERQFCHHDLPHFLDVARIGMILSEKEALPLPQEWIYAAALLHDIGRHRQYESSMPHEQASAGIAAMILPDCGFDDKETDVIIYAISHHRDKAMVHEKNLSGILYRADKMSRACYACGVVTQCNAKRQEKEQGLIL